MKITCEFERFQGIPGEPDFYTITLSGETYQARETIKGLGDYEFNDPVGCQKAWRSKRIFFDKVAEKQDIIRLLQKTKTALIETGAQFVMI